MAERAAPLSRREWLAGSSLVLLLGVPQIAWGATILAVRVWPAADYTRVTIESDGLLSTRQVFVANPPRLAVDIEGIELSPALRELVGKVKPDDPFISGVRVGQYAPGIVRLVLDLRQSALPQVFNLPPVAAYQHRLVLDLHPAQPVDPLEALIREKTRAAGGTAGSTAAGAAGGATAAVPATPSSPAGSPSTGAAGTATDPLGELIAQRAGGAASGAAHGRVPAASTAGAPAAGKPAGAAPVAKPTAPPGSPAAPATPNIGAGPATGQAAGQPNSAAAAPADRPAPGNGTERLIIVALDPGHGGEDPGAIGPGGTREKDVVLSIARQMRERINDQRIRVHGGTAVMRAFMTRDADFFVPLHVRVNKARRVQADLFVSIHADAFFTPTARGASVFALSERGASSSAARWMAARENQADAVGGINVRTADAAVQRALLDMSTTAQINDSLKLGSSLLGEIGRVGRLHKPRVEQAGFAVLKAPDIPSVLVETAFISNPEEEQRLADPAYQAELADALVRGIQRYFAANPPLARNRPL